MFTRYSMQALELCTGKLVGFIPARRKKSLLSKSTWFALVFSLLLHAFR